MSTAAACADQNGETMSEPTTRDFYVYRERNGTPAVTDSLSRVPKYGKKSLRVITLPRQDDDEPFLSPSLLEKVLAAPKDAVADVVAGIQEKATVEQKSAAELRPATPATGPATGFDPTSLLVGAGIGFSFALVGARLLKAPGWIIKIGLALAVLTLCSGLYFGMMRRQLGVGKGEVFAHPGVVVEDAKKAVDSMNQRTATKEATLEQINREIEKTSGQTGRR